MFTPTSLFFLLNFPVLFPFSANRYSPLNPPTFLPIPYFLLLRGYIYTRDDPHRARVWPSSRDHCPVAIQESHTLSDGPRLLAEHQRNCARASSLALIYHPSTRNCCASQGLEPNKVNFTILRTLAISLLCFIYFRFGELF